MTLLHKRPFDAVLWWEKRRLLFNLVLLPVGLATVAAIEIVGGYVFPPGEDAIEPMGLLVGVAAYAFAANFGYTLGWITELLWSGGNTEFTEGYRRRIFRLGLLFSVGLTLLPAVVIPSLWLFSGAAGTISVEHVYGTYVAQYPFATDTIVLGRDGKFTQQVEVTNNPPSKTIRGTWSFDPKIAYVMLDTYISVDNGFGKLNPKWRIPFRGNAASLPMERFFWSTTMGSGAEHPYAKM